MRQRIADLVHHKVLAILAAALLVSTTVGCSALGVESIRLPDGDVKVSGLAGADPDPPVGLQRDDRGAGGLPGD